MDTQTPTPAPADTTNTYPKVHKSAVCIIPPKEVWEQIQAIRSKHDKAYERWPPHINLLYPFLPEEFFQEAKRRVNLSNIQPFQITFKEMSCFTHGKNSTLILKPFTNKPNEVQDLQKNLEKTFPFCDDLSTISTAGFMPHLTLGQFPTTSVTSVIRDFEAKWKSISFTVDAIHFISRGDDSPFQIKESIPLGETTANPLPPLAKEEVTENTAIFQKEEKDGLLRLKIPYESKGANVHQILVVDSSGSMAGDPWKQVVKTMEFIKSMGGNPDVVLYHSTAKRVTLDYAIKSSESGMTNFGDAFQELKKAIQDVGSPTISVIFMTDGQDNGTKDMNDAQKQLKFFLRNCGKNVVVNTLGFGSGINQKFLEELKDVGTREGMFRFAKDNSLEEKFSELFVYSETTLPVSLYLNGDKSKAYTTEAEVYEGHLEVSYWIKDVDVKSVAFSVKEVEGELQVSSQPVDTVFKILRIKNREIVTQEDLHKAQEDLYQLKFVKGSNRSERIAAMEAREEVQEILDKYHQILAETAKSNTKNATLSSLRYEAKFTKSRRQRLMNMRAAKNSKETSQIQSKLQSLKFSEKDFEKIDLETFTCDLLGEDIFSIMKEDFADILGFGLNVSRPEHGIESPSNIVINEIGSTFVSQSAITEAIKFKMVHAGPEQAHGGFSMEKSSAFQGRAREPINAFLPLFINEAHWNRVSLQLKPILGYFFTLDPLGYDDSQLVAIFTVLGHMVSTSNDTERSRLMLQDFKTVCQKVLPLATQYLGKDILDEFIKGPAGRTKSVVHNLVTIIGWAYARDIPVENFRLPLMEETYRRLFTTFFHAKSRTLVLDHLKDLLYVEDQKDEDKENTKEEEEEKLEGDQEEEEEETKEEKDDSNNNNNNNNAETPTPLTAQDKLRGKKKAALDSKFEKWALFSLGFSSKKVAEPTDTIDVPTQFVERIIAATNHPSIQSKVAQLIQSVDASFMQNVVVKLGGKWQVDDDLLRGMLVQSLRYCHNSLVNSGVTSGQYKNTWEDGLENTLKSLHEEFEKARQQDFNTQVDDLKCLLLGKRTVLSNSNFAFVGRLLKYSTTRGGKVFNNVISLLHDSMIPVPHRYDKLKIIYTGVIAMGETEKAAISNGMAWRADTATIEQTKAILGEDLFTKLQVSMRGRFANHVYRLSDIPNRHGYHNSHPNPSLVYRF